MTPPKGFSENSSEMPVSALALCMTKSSLGLSENEVSVDPQALPVLPLSSPEGGSAVLLLSYSTGYGGVDVLSNPLSPQTWQ